MSYYSSLPFSSLLTCCAGSALPGIPYWSMPSGLGMGDRARQKATVE